MNKEGTADNSCVSHTSKGRWWEQEATGYKGGGVGVGDVYGHQYDSRKGLFFLSRSEEKDLLRAAIVCC